MSVADSGGEATSWRLAEPEQFAATVGIAAANLGVQPLAVEKDYWVCEALRAVVTAFPDDIVFKGGTSLEKLRLIRRFSEDLDILVIGNYESDRAAKTALKEMCRLAAEATGAAESDAKSGGTSGNRHRRAYLNPPLLEQAQGDSAIADATAVLVELGQSGGRHPYEIRQVTSLLTRELAAADFAIDGFADLAPFDVPILAPGRTLLEKLLRINNFAVDPEVGGAHGWLRIGRQFYDIWALLGDEGVHELLDDADAVGDILTSCYDVSEQFGGDHPIPGGGFANCPAFDTAGELRERLEMEHDRAMATLYYGDEAPPTFAQVLERIREQAERLACGA